MCLEPFGFAQRNRGRAKRAKLIGPAFEDRRAFMKSGTPNPEEKRAERAVGSTWFEPPT